MPRQVHQDEGWLASQGQLGCGDACVGSESGGIKKASALDAPDVLPAVHPGDVLRLCWQRLDKGIAALPE